MPKASRRFFITDDNFARNKDWEPIFDRIIELRERDKIDVRLIIQVDTLCHKIPNFVAKAARAGVTRVFIGLENINPANLLAAKKRQNKITEYRKMLLAWKNAGVVTYAGYILGFPGDTPESIREDIEIIKKELPLDILEFFCLTPLPGSEDHKVLWQKGAWMDPDMNKYDLEHVVADHPKMTRRGMGRHLSRRLGRLLHARAHGDDPAARRRERHGHVAAARGAVLLLDLPSGGERASAAGRRVPPQVSARPAARSSDRAGVVVLSASFLGCRHQARAHRQALDVARPHAPAREAGAAAQPYMDQAR